MEAVHGFDYATVPHRRGEYSGKDLEAVMSRTVLVKPLASMLRIYPNVYEAGVTCEEVAPQPRASCLSQT